MTLKGIFGSMSVFTMQASTRHCRESLAFTITLQRSENAFKPYGEITVYKQGFH